MRAKTSWPRSSVPNGWAALGVLRRALKSMSLIDSFQSSGPKATISTIAVKTTRPSTASLWRRKRRHASAAGETLRRRGASCALAIADAGVEPAIEQVGDQVEEDDEAREDEGHGHDHRRVVAQDRVDQERADAGHAEDLLGDDGAAEDLRRRQRHQRHHR